MTPKEAGIYQHAPVTVTYKPADEEDEQTASSSALAFRTFTVGQTLTIKASAGWLRAPCALLLMRCCLGCSAAAVWVAALPSRSTPSLPARPSRSRCGQGWHNIGAGPPPKNTAHSVSATARLGAAHAHALRVPPSRAMLASKVCLRAVPSRRTDPVLHLPL